MREIREEVSSGAYLYRKTSQTLDLDYDWVHLFVRDQALRQEIKSIEEEIKATRNLPIAKSELRENFKQQREAIKLNFVALVRDSLGDIQKKKTNELFKDVGPGMLRLVPLLILDEADVDTIFQNLENGVSQDIINKKVSKLEARIQEIQQEIDRDLSPKSRWYHTPEGDVEPYPNGCRWFEFVNEWKDIARRYTEPVNYQGNKLSTSGEIMAWNMLGFDKLEKIYPLQKP